MYLGTVEEIHASKQLLHTRRIAIKKSKDQLIHKSYGLHAGDFKTFAATKVLAHDQVVAPHHVRAGLGELGAVAFVGAGRETLLFCAHQPLDFVFRGLVAMRTRKRVGLFGFFFVEEISFVHLTLYYQPRRA